MVDFNRVSSFLVFRMDFFKNYFFPPDKDEGVDLKIIIVFMASFLTIFFVRSPSRAVSAFLISCFISSFAQKLIGQKVSFDNYFFALLLEITRLDGTVDSYS